MNRYIYLPVVILFFNYFLMAQSEQRKYCGTDKLMQEALSNPEKKQVLDQLEIFTKEFISNLDRSRQADPYIIPVVVHVIHNFEEENISYEQIDNGIARINEDFNGLNDDVSEVIEHFADRVGFPGMEFRLATKDPEGNCTYGVTKTATPWTYESGSKVMQLVNWDDKKYVNIYVVNTFDENMESAAAYATKPGSGSDEYGDYIFCRYDYFGDWNTSSDNGPTGNNWQRHTLPHEMGHFFNLDHPWGGSNSPGDEDLNCSIDDGVEDTPWTIGTDGNAVGCPLEQNTCEDLAPSPLFPNDTLDNVQNIMDYSSCAHMFTQGQADRMIAAANSLAGNRSNLWQPENLIATGTDNESWNNNPYAECAPIPDFKTNNSITLGCPESMISFENFTYNYRTENITYNWIFEGGDPLISSLKDPVVEYVIPGTYDVTLSACNGGFCRDTTMVDYITVLSQTSVSVESGFSQSFESADFPNMDSEIWWGGNAHNEQHWERTEDASSVGNSSLRIKSQNYNYQRNSHEFSTPELNISEFAIESSQLFISFDYAYARRLPYTAAKEDDDGFVVDTYPIHYDELIISYKQCDDTLWTERPRLSTRPGTEGLYLSLQESLITTDKIYFNSFKPQPGLVEDGGEWKNYKMSLSIQQDDIIDDPSIIVRFEFNGTGEDQYDFHLVDMGVMGFDYQEFSTIGGNWLYIDNVRIGTSDQVSSTRNTTNTTNLVVIPNPTVLGSGMISFDLLKDESVSITLANLLGTKVDVKQLSLEAGHHDLKISDVFNVNKKGSYIVSIQGVNSRASEMILIK